MVFLFGGFIGSVPGISFDVFLGAPFGYPLGVFTIVNNFFIWVVYLVGF